MQVSHKPPTLRAALNPVTDFLDEKREASHVCQERSQGRQEREHNYYAPSAKPLASKTPGAINQHSAKNTNPNPASALEEPFSTQEHSCTRLPRVWLKSHGQVQLGWELCLWLETSHPSSDSHSLANSTVSWANVQGSKAGTIYRAGREEAFAFPGPGSWLPDCCNVDGNSGAKGVTTPTLLAVTVLIPA